MKNVYDILVNFKKNAYEFYEWKKDDEITHIKKTISFKVSDDLLYDFLNSDVVVEKDFLEKIKNVTELFSKGSSNSLKYCVVLFNKDISAAFKLNDLGEITGKSKLLFDESDEIVKLGKKEGLTKINYNVIKYNKDEKLFTRKQKNTIYLLNKYIKDLYNNKKSDELKYLYIECFDEEEENIDLIYSNFCKKIENYNNNIIETLISLIKVIKK